MLAEAGGLEGLGRAGPDTLMRLRGIGRVRAARIRAAIELGRRAARLPAPGRSLTEERAARLRGQVPVGACAVFAVSSRGEGPQRVGDAFDEPGGTLVLRLLELGSGPYDLVAVRPGGKPTRIERVAARRLLGAARAAGVVVDRLELLSAGRRWCLAFWDPVVEAAVA